MQNIHVRRYETPNQVHYQGWIEPEDRSWILFIEKDGTPQLYLEVEVEEEEGKTVRGYVPAELTGERCMNP
jgi:hypothetical protein